MKYSNLKYIFSFLLVAFSFNAEAQTELKSKVSDFLTYMPIESASIYIENSTVGTISNKDGNFLLVVPREFENDTVVVSSIGYKTFKTAIQDFDPSMDIFLEEDIAALDEVLIVADSRPKTGNDIVLRAIKKLENNLPEQPYLQKGFLRHKERNNKEFKWLIESALTMYDSSYVSGATENLKINVDETRKSYDLRDVDSLFSYYSYLKNTKRNFKMKSKKMDRDTIKTSSLVEAIKWNDRRFNGLENIFKGRLNLVRNSNMDGALFGKNMLNKHQFELDTVLVDNGKKLYKIKISKSRDFVGLNTGSIFNEGYEANGWIYIYWDNFAIKRIEYELVAASDAQKSRSKILFNSKVKHKLIITYKEYQDKMYPNYFYYETPKLVKVGDRSSDKPKGNKEEQYYHTIQEILFTEIIHDPETINKELQKEWSEDIFTPRPYNKEFWKNYNVILESEEDEQLIYDLSRRASLFKQ